jgi:hypothetical protein|tara:strand:- start:331 stop:456 length:126 start_codon:yes stop_codon:yes gene_type:complete
MKLIKIFTRKLIKYLGVFYVFGIILNLSDKSKQKKKNKDLD